MNIVRFGFQPSPLGHTPTSNAPLLPSHSPGFTQPSGESQHVEYGSGNHNNDMACWSRSTRLSSSPLCLSPSDNLFSSVPLVVICGLAAMWGTCLVVLATILTLGSAQQITTTDDVSLPSPMNPRRCRGEDERRAKSGSRLFLHWPTARVDEVSKSSTRNMDGPTRTTDTSVGRTDDI